MNEKDKREIEKKIDSSIYSSVLIALVCVYLTLMAGASLPMLQYWFPPASSIGQNNHNPTATASSASRPSKVARYMTEEQVTRLVWSQNMGMLCFSVAVVIGPGIFAFIEWMGKVGADSVQNRAKKDQEKNERGNSECR